MTRPEIPVPAEGDAECPLEDAAVELSEPDDGGLFERPARPRPGRTLL
ncbi:hypothetical protein [Streptosporangium jomthongense]|uniref:Uncharacterized protein n=1 Tax=Streptosporangium jomthongense TaxID=1193683 RepID=A0ABV8FC22_9ACTN